MARRTDIRIRIHGRYCDRHEPAGPRGEVNRDGTG